MVGVSVHFRVCYGWWEVCFCPMWVRNVCIGNPWGFWEDERDIDGKEYESSGSYFGLGVPSAIPMKESSVFLY